MSMNQLESKSRFLPFVQSVFNACYPLLLTALGGGRVGFSCSFRNMISHERSTSDESSA